MASASTQVMASEEVFSIIYMFYTIFCKMTKAETTLITESYMCMKYFPHITLCSSVLGIFDTDIIQIYIESFISVSASVICRKGLNHEYKLPGWMSA